MHDPGVNWVKSVIEHYSTYLALQENITRAIQTRDDEALSRLERETQDVLRQAQVLWSEAEQKGMSGNLGDAPDSSSLRRLRDLIERSQSQIQVNREALKGWLREADGMLPHAQPISARPAFPSTSLGGWANLKIKESPSNQADHPPAGDASTSGPLQGPRSPWGDKQAVESVGGQIDRHS